MNKTNHIAKAVNILRTGGLVAFPTETVYGLGADARNEAAIRKIFEAKERPYDHPLIVHIAAFAEIHVWAKDVPDVAERLAEAVWPGPLTMILRRQPGVLDSVTGGQETVGIRIPRHPIATALLQAFGGGLAAPSANKFTHVSPTTAAAVAEELGAAVDLILDGGACDVGLESTIIDMTQATPVILRPGMIRVDEIAAIIGVPVASSRQDTRVVRVPGMHHLHYAPTTKTVRLAKAEMAGFLQAQRPEAGRIAVMGLGAGEAYPNHVQYVRMPLEAGQYAHDLYHTLRTLDAGRFAQIIVEAVPGSVEWEAIRDRIAKACGEG